MTFANEFSEIAEAVQNNEELRNSILTLVLKEPIKGKIQEGGNRDSKFRMVLNAFFLGTINFEQAVSRTGEELARESSAHGSDNRVFSAGWETRHIKTQISRFYNQAVLEHLVEMGAEYCLVPHSQDEQGDSRCTKELAGTQQSVTLMHSRLVNSYSKGQWSKDLKIPHHPHCSHVIKPIQ